MKKFERLLLGFNIIFILIAAAMMIITGVMGKYDRITFWNSWDAKYVNEWTLVDTDGNRQDITLPKKVYANRGEPVAFEAIIPDDVQDDDGYMFLSMYASVEVYVEDQLITSFAKEPPMSFGRLVGNVRVIAPMKAEYAGKTIRVVYREYHSMSYSFSKVMYGSVGDLKLYVVYANLWRLFIASILLAVCIICIFMSFMQFMKNARANNRAFFHLGMFILFALIWLICSSDLPQMFDDKAELASLLSFISLSILPMHYASFCGEIMPKSRKIFSILRMLGWIVALLEIVGYSTDFMDAYDPLFGFVQLLTFNHLVMLLVAVFSIQQSIKYRKTSKHIAAYSKANIVFVLMVVMALFFYYALQTSSLDGIFMSSGLVVFTSMLLAIIVKMEIEVLEDSRRTEIYKELAYTDIQTGLQNRGAFNAIFLDTSFEENPVVDLVILDINRLKWTNDNLGHLAGDEMILATANCIKKSFEAVGSCYRIGGDEFAVVLFDKHDIVDECIEKMDKLIQKYNSMEGSVRVTVSRGYASMKYDGTANFMDGLFTRADREMYANKSMWHAKDVT